MVSKWWLNDYLGPSWSLKFHKENRISVFSSLHQITLQGPCKQGFANPKDEKRPKYMDFNIPWSKENRVVFLYVNMTSRSDSLTSSYADIRIKTMLFQAEPRHALYSGHSGEERRRGISPSTLTPVKKRMSRISLLPQSLALPPTTRKPINNTLTGRRNRWFGQLTKTDSQYSSVSPVFF